MSTAQHDVAGPVVLGVAGSAAAVANSLSPTMFAAAFQALDMRGYYVPLAIRDRAARKALRSLPRLGFRGVNVTMPLKHVAAEVAHTRSELVERTGVANTLIVDDEGQLHAEATDGLAVEAAIGAAGVELRGATVTVLGAGGAATAAAWACAAAGASHIQLWNRTANRSESVAKILRGAFPDLGLEVCGSLPIHVPAHILVSAVPADSFAGEELAGLGVEALVVDLAYRHDRLPTPLIRAARERGVRSVDGRDVLVRQGAASFALWFGFAPPIEVMLRAVS